VCVAAGSWAVRPLGGRAGAHGGPVEGADLPGGDGVRDDPQRPRTDAAAAAAGGRRQRRLGVGRRRAGLLFATTAATATAEPAAAAARLNQAVDSAGHPPSSARALWFSAAPLSPFLPPS
jgi:hypothetical protein